MKKASLVLGILAIGLTGIFFLSGVLGNFNKSSAQKNQFNKWEYGAITSVFYFEPEKQRIDKIFGIVEFCKMTNQGCKRQEIRYELDYGKFLKQSNLSENFNTRKIASQKASEFAFQKALSQLGNLGWEMIDSNPAQDFTSINLYDYEKSDNKSFLTIRQNTKAVYFKRFRK